MRRFIATLLLISCFLVSCGAEITTETETTFDTDKINIIVSEVTTETPETEPPLPCLIGFYDELTAAGTYTRIHEWNQPWIMGRDIAVFDIIPSSEETLTGHSYKKLWIQESEKISDTKVKPYFLLEYVLKDGTEKSCEIKDYSDCDAVIDEGYLEVYLYDDIHQDGGWYYHLTESTTNEETVISSFKLTAGKEILSVDSIRLTAYLEGSSPSTIEITNGSN